MKTGTPAIVAWASACTLVVAACPAGRLAQTDASHIPPEARAAIIHDLRDQAESVGSDEILAGTKFVEDSSRVLKSLVYYWGSFRPAASHDATFLSVVAWRDGRATAIHNLPDWNKIARVPKALDGHQLLALCEEAVRVSSRLRTLPRSGSFIQQLSDLRADSPALRDSGFLARFTPPRFEPDSARPVRAVAWMVWPIEGAWKLSCTLDSIGGAIAIAHVDSVFAMGVRRDTGGPR